MSDVRTSVVGLRPLTVKERRALESSWSRYETLSLDGGASADAAFASYDALWRRLGVVTLTDGSRSRVMVDESLSARRGDPVVASGPPPAAGGDHARGI
jgi:hypothetical protein